MHNIDLNIDAQLMILKAVLDVNTRYGQLPVDNTHEHVGTCRKKLIPHHRTDILFLDIGDERRAIDEITSADIGRTIVFRCRLSAIRGFAKVAFLNVRQRIHSIQVSCASSPDGPSIDMVKWIRGLPLESILLIEGVVRSSDKLKDVPALSVKFVEIEAEKVR